MGDTDKQFAARLIEDFYYNLELLELAKNAGANDIVKIVKRKLEIIKLQLQPLELPEIPND